MKNLIFLLVFCFTIVGCTRPDSARELLTKEGYTDIEITGYAWFACSEDDKFQTGFRARKNGQVIEGAICEGLILKNKTIRYK